MTNEELMLLQEALQAGSDAVGFQQDQYGGTSLIEEANKKDILIEKALRIIRRELGVQS